MGVLSSTIILKNQMTGVLQNITDSMNMVINAASNVESATKNAFDVKSLNAAKEKIREAEMSIQAAAEEQENFNRKLDEGSNYANKLKGMIKSALVTYASFRSVKAFVGLSDEMTQIRARLDAINDGHQTTLELQEMIFQSAQRARGEYKMTMDIVSKLGAQAKNAFASNQETIAFAENLNKLFTISGTSAQGVESVMYNLTQAMASGVLRGQDLNAVMANTPQLVQIIADYMDAPIGQIRKLAEEGQLSADVVKNALISASDDITKEFENMPMTFSQIGVSLKNQFINSIEPALQRLNDFANSQEFQVFADRAAAAIGVFAETIVRITTYAVEFANFVGDHWGAIEPVIWQVVGALGGLELATIAVKLQTLSLNAVLEANPIYLIASAIGILIALLVRWTNSVGGVCVAYLIVVNSIKSFMASLVISMLNHINLITFQWDKFQVGIKRVKNGVLNALSNMKVKGLTIISDFLNGVIQGINKLIGLVNMIPGVSIEAIDKVNLFAGAKAQAAADKAEREAEVESAMEMANQNFKARESSVQAKALKYEQEKNAREKEIASKQAKKLSKSKESSLGSIPKFDIPGYSELPGIAKDTKDAKNAAKGTNKNTEKLKDGIEVKNEDISHLRDLMERRAIQNFSFDKLEVIANNQFGDIHETADLDGWMEGLTDRLTEAVETTMGGVPQYE